MLPSPSTLEHDPHNTARFTTVALHAIARAEAAGRISHPRLTEPGLATWRRFRGRLGARHLAQLMIQDAAVVQPLPFDPARFPEANIGLDRLTDDHVEAWLAGLDSLDLKEPATDFIAAQARSLGLPSRFARSVLHRVKSHHTVIELPGTGGQIALHLVTTQDDLHLSDNLVICTASWQEDLLAGLVSAELGVQTADHVHRDPTLDWAREELRTKADYVMGLGPDRGGPFEEPRLRTLFPNARIVLI